MKKQILNELIQICKQKKKKSNTSYQVFLCSTETSSNDVGDYAWVILRDWFLKGEKEILDVFRDMY